MFRYRLGDLFSYVLAFTIFTIVACSKSQLPVSLGGINSPENPDIRVQMLIEGDAKSPFSRLVHVPSSAAEVLPGYEKYIAIQYCNCDLVYSRRNPGGEGSPDQANLNIRPNVSRLPWKKIDSIKVPWIKVEKAANRILFAWDKDVLQEIILKNEKNELFIVYFEKLVTIEDGGAP